MAVLLVGFGGPDAPADVRPFLLNVVAGRNVPEARLEAVARQYEQIGGASPFNKLSRLQVEALSRKLEAMGTGEKVYYGCLHWHPYIKDTVNEMLAAGETEATVFVLAPHRTQENFGRYLETVQTAGADLQLRAVAPWHDQKLFINAIASRICAHLADMEATKRQNCQIIFTAHSIPCSVPDAQGYSNQVADTAHLVTVELEKRYGHRMHYCTAWQSRSGQPSDPWLEPDITERLKQCKEGGLTDVVVVPVGFLVDHAEVLYDLDILAAGCARELGLTMWRVPTVGDQEEFIELLAQLVTQGHPELHANANRQ